MKALHFQATAPVAHSGVIGALMGQTATTLRPFNNFISQAIHTAKDRQVRYQLPWKRVHNLITVSLEAQDTVLRVHQREHGVLLIDWPTENQGDLNQRAFVVNRSVLVTVVRATLTPKGLRVTTEPPLNDGDQLMWCGHQSTVTRETETPTPALITNLHGTALPLRKTPQQDGEHDWLLTLVGKHEDRELWIDSQRMDVEPVPPKETLNRVSEQNGTTYPVENMTLRVESEPAEKVLLGDDGVHYLWHTTQAEGRHGNWVQLLPPARSNREGFVDPRAAFCEGDVREVWTQAWHNPQTTYTVRKVDPDRYQLLLRDLPPEDSTLYLPINLSNLYLQQRALRQLTHAPLPHHQGLLRLCEDPKHVRWPLVEHTTIAAHNWQVLTDETRSGTLQQRRFVSKALASLDFAFLEGPPGSGKTTAICEIVQQLVAAGKRVLLCASTHVAIDNVLERLLETNSPIDAVRIGKLDKVDDNVRATQLDTRIEILLQTWRAQPEMRRYDTGELEEMATRTVIMAANLTCGTTMGITKHPLFDDKNKHDRGTKRGARLITTMPHWDVLIVDEASKTLIQEFMVPALMARRWIVVGDVRQLPPFADRADIVANLRDLVDHKDQKIFPRDHQRAKLLLYRLLRRETRQPGMRWLFVEPPRVLDSIARELKAAPPPDLSVVRVVAVEAGHDDSVTLVTLDQLRSGAPEAMHVAAADWVLVADNIVQEAAPLLPTNLLFMNDPTAAANRQLSDTSSLLFRQGWWLERTAPLQRPYRERRSRKREIKTKEASQANESKWLNQHTLADEIAWRLTRLHELRHSSSDQERKRLRNDLEILRPRAVDISDALEEIEEIGLPSILEVLQEGIGVERSSRPSALTAGLRASREADFDARFESLTFQHRMHPEIASFPREVIYQGESLQDANTIPKRDEKLGWDFGDFGSRFAWAHVMGQDKGGRNADEIAAMRGLMLDFIAWAKRAGPPQQSEHKYWEVALLSFYLAQHNAMSRMLQKLTGDTRKTRFIVPGAPVEIVCGTVDRFQGREANLVALSMKNTGRIGFLDSPNRLNVAVTRARQQLIVFGNAEYFERCSVQELRELARRTHRVDPNTVRRWRREKK